MTAHLVANPAVAVPRPGPPLGVAVRLAAGEGRPGVVVGPDGQLPPDAVAELLADRRLGIGAVVPVVLSAQGRLLEAGADVDGDDLRPAGWGADRPGGEHLHRRDVQGTTYSWICVRAEVVRSAGLPPDLDDIDEVVEHLLRANASLGLRTVLEPGWQVAVAPGARTDTARRHPGGRVPLPAAEMLLVTDFLPADRLRFEERSLQWLIARLLEHVPDARLTVLATDGFRGEASAAALRARGVEVHHGPLDRRSWLREHAFRFSNVIITWDALRTDVAAQALATQPQATSSLFLPSLPTRSVDAIPSMGSPVDAEGLDQYRGFVEGRLKHAGSWADSVLCATARDVPVLRGAERFRRVDCLRPSVDPLETASVLHRDRSGIVILAVDGPDVLDGNEDAAIFALEHLLPPIRRRHPDTPCQVVSEAPSPRLDTACRAQGATLTPVRELREAVSRAALLIAAHQHGTGGRVAVLEALEAGTPFLASPVAVADLELGQLRDEVTCGTPYDMVVRARQLIGDRDSWQRLATAIVATVRDQFAPRLADAEFRELLAPLGCLPAPAGTVRWPDPPLPSPPRPPIVLTDLRPPGWSPTPPTAVIDSTDENVRYKEWARRFGPNPSTLRALKADVDAAPYQPLISVLMPVYNTEPELLRKAVGSVADQIYPHWQLCIADDGSDRQETLALLDELKANPAVRVRHLPGNSGISAATNAALELAEGEFVAFLDHDDVLKPHALAQVVRWLNGDATLDVIYSDEDKVDEQDDIKDPVIKPDWSPDMLRSHNYVCHLMVLRRSLLERIGGLRPAYDGSQDYDVILRAAAQTDRIAHIPEPLYSWRVWSGSTAESVDAKPWAFEAAHRALEDAIKTADFPATVHTTQWHGQFRVRYHVPGQPKVAVIVPTRDRSDLLRHCLDSVLTKTGYRNYEVVVVDNQTTERAALEYMESLPVRVLRYPHTFNYARMMNLAAAEVQADALCFLNNDTEVLDEAWIDSLLEHAMRPEVGAVGPRLLHASGRAQHEGIYVGIIGWAVSFDHCGYHLLGNIIRNTSAVTGACTMVRPSVFWRVGGNDERLRVAYNDVDLCLRIRQAGFQVVYTPLTELRHEEGQSREGAEPAADAHLFDQRWEARRRVDPYYSPMWLRDELFRINLGEPDRPLPAVSPPTD